MPILVACKCGKKLRVKDELAGKRVKCPGCAQVVTVPAAEEPPELEEIEPAEERVTTPSARRAKPAARPEPEDVRPADDEAAEEGRPSRGAASPTPYWVNGRDLLAL